jgi:hypothetical protein
MLKMWGIGVQSSVSTNNQESNVYNDAQKYTDQSVKDTMIQNYITKITTRNEDVNELVKNFTNNVSAEADSIQKNSMEFAGCIELDGAIVEQTNELIQDVKQGFEKLNEDAKTLKKVIDAHSDTQTTSEQGSKSTQGATSTTDQSATQEQESTQTTEQKMEMFSTSLNRYNRLLNQERFGNKSNLYTNLVRNDKKKSIREHFASLMYPKEGFCLFGCVSVSSAASVSNQKSNAINKDLQTNIQTQDIYKKIDTAYDKTVETITKISEVINETTNSIASASSIQINELKFDTESVCQMKLKNLDLTQRNKLEQNVELTTAIQNINSLTTDTEVKAIMVDMMGLTQSSETDQDAKNETTQKSDQSQKSTQETKQTLENKPPIGLGIIGILLVVGVAFMIFKAMKGKDGYFDGSPIPKNKNINDISTEH